MRFAIPTRALALILIIMPAAGWFGCLAGSWPVPLLLSIVRDGWEGIHQVPVGYGFANLPAWLDPKVDRALYFLAFLADAVFMLVGLVGLGLLGGRFCGYLLVKKLSWMTEEEVREFSKRDPGV